MVIFIFYITLITLAFATGLTFAEHSKTINKILNVIFKEY